MEHTYAKSPGIEVRGAFRLTRKTGLPAKKSSRETAGFLVDINAKAELLAGTGRGQHGSGVKIKDNESGWDLHVSSGSARGPLNIDECEKS